MSDYRDMTNVTPVNDPTDIFTQFFIKPSSSDYPSGYPININFKNDLKAIIAIISGPPATVEQYIRRYGLWVVYDVDDSSGPVEVTSGVFTFEIRDEESQFRREYTCWCTNRSLVNGDSAFSLYIDCLLDVTYNHTLQIIIKEVYGFPSTVSGVNVGVIEWPHARNDAYNNNIGTIQGQIDSTARLMNAFGYTSQFHMRTFQFQTVTATGKPTPVMSNPQAIDSQNLALNLISDDRSDNQNVYNIMNYANGNIQQLLNQDSEEEYDVAIPIAETSNVGSFAYVNVRDNTTWTNNVLGVSDWKAKNPVGFDKYESFLYQNRRNKGQNVAVLSKALNNSLYVALDSKKYVIGHPQYNIAEATKYFSTGINAYGGTPQNLTHKILRRVTRQDRTTAFHGAVFDSGLTQSLDLPNNQFDCTNDTIIHGVSFGISFDKQDLIFSQYELQWDNGGGTGGPTQHDSLDSWRDTTEQTIRNLTTWRALFNMRQMAKQYGRPPLMSLGGPLLGVESYMGFNSSYGARELGPSGNIPSDGWAVGVNSDEEPDITGSVIPFSAASNYNQTLRTWESQYGYGSLSQAALIAGQFALLQMINYFRIRAENYPILPQPGGLQRRTTERPFEFAALAAAEATPINLPPSVHRLTVDQRNRMVVRTKGIGVSGIHKKYLNK